jgi:hypothetical protein
MYVFNVYFGAQVQSDFLLGLKTFNLNVQTPLPGLVEGVPPCAEACKLQFRDRAIAFTHTAKPTVLED